MREIKFRAWWVKDFSGEEKNIMLHNVHDFYDTLGEERHGNEFEPANSFGELLDNPEEYIVMQYTGLTDKNGKEIFEGDIVTAEDLICVVEWGSYGWVAKWRRVRNNRGTIDYGKPNLGFRSHEVIGNIYENPELLGAEK